MSTNEQLIQATARRIQKQIIKAEPCQYDGMQCRKAVLPCRNTRKITVLELLPQGDHAIPFYQVQVPGNPGNGEHLPLLEAATKALAIGYANGDISGVGLQEFAGMGFQPEEGTSLPCVVNMLRPDNYTLQMTGERNCTEAQGRRDTYEKEQLCVLGVPVAHRNVLVCSEAIGSQGK